MQLQGRNLKLDLRGADVRLLQFELRLLDLDTPDEEAFENNFGEGTREAVLKFQSESDLERTGEVDRATAKRINEVIRQRVPADEGLERLVEAVKSTLELIDALDPNTGDLRTQIERFSETLKAFTIALDTLRELGAPEDLAAEVEEMLVAGRSRLEELADAPGNDDDGAPAPFVVYGCTISRELRGLVRPQVEAFEKGTKV